MDHQELQFYQLDTSTDDFSRDVLSGLRQVPRQIPPKYFYDEKGSQLFDAITNTVEYYPTRTEIGILQTSAKDIASIVGTGRVLIEPGGGSCSKVRLLLNELRPRAYIPMDISAQHLRTAAGQTAIDYPWLQVCAVCVDFSQQLSLPDETPSGDRIAFFPGSTIGNFHPQQARRFLADLAKMVATSGYLLIGVDLKKERTLLNAAYNDRQGFTAAFNLNLLTRINDLLGANFVPAQWQHYAFYNEQQGRIEMHLRSRREQTVNINNETFEFDTGETIHTENSYKYSCEEFSALAESAGFESRSVWVDDDQLFSVHLLQAKS